MQGMSSLHLAASSAQVEVAEFLLQRGEDADHRDDDVKLNLAAWPD